MSIESINALLSLLREKASKHIEKAIDWAKAYKTTTEEEYDLEQLFVIVFLYESVRKERKIGNWLCDVTTKEEELAKWINCTFLFEKESVYDAFQIWMKSEVSVGHHITRKLNRKYEIMKEAAYRSDNDLIKWLIANGINPNVTYYHRKTALHVAAAKGHTDSVKILLENGASILVLDYKCRRPFDLAFKSKHFHICDLMWETFVGGKLMGNESVLIDAVRERERDAVVYITKKCDVETVWSSLKVAVEEGNSDIVETLLISCPAVQNVSNEEKKKTLTVAVTKNFMNITEKLIAFGFEMDESLLEIARENKMSALLEWFDN